MSRRDFLKSTLAATGALAFGRNEALAEEPRGEKPNVLFIMTDQQRADTIALLGNAHIYTPNLDRLVKRGIAFTQAYSTCPVCVPARYTIRTGCEPPTTGVYSNSGAKLVEGQPPNMEDRCGKYLARTMAGMGYRTFGIGKSHTIPPDEDLGYEVHLHSEELYGSPEDRKRDAYAAFIAKEHPEYDWIEMLMGERTEMYYMPQMSPTPAHLGVEAWAADRAIEQIRMSADQPYFGFVSFVGPHPPFAPPLPYNRMYDPDRMPNPIRGDIALDHMDEMIPSMNHAIWAEDINDPHARVLKARYYGEISYIDHCLGRILDAVESRPDGDNTLICFFTDHGDHLGDHYAWQKESFFEASCHIPFLLSWPKRLPKDAKCDDLVCLTDLFGIATTAGGRPELRQGVDVLGNAERGMRSAELGAANPKSGIRNSESPRQRVIGYYGAPGTDRFKVMVREGDWKYIFIANGGREQLFNVAEDPNELRQRLQDAPDVAKRLRQSGTEALSVPNANRALDGGNLRSFPYTKWERGRIYQFDASRGVRRFPERAEDVVKGRSGAG